MLRNLLLGACILFAAAGGIGIARADTTVGVMFLINDAVIMTAKIDGGPSTPLQIHGPNVFTLKTSQKIEVWLGENNGFNMPPQLICNYQVAAADDGKTIALMVTYNIHLVVARQWSCSPSTLH